MIDERYVGEFQEQAVRGMNAEFAVAQPIASLAKLVTEQEATGHTRAIGNSAPKVYSVRQASNGTASFWGTISLPPPRH